MLGPILSTGDVGYHELAGAVALYLLLGLGFSNVFEIVFQLDPTSFLFDQTAFGEAPAFTVFLYFSFVTLATLGYGDVSPVSRVAILTAVLEPLLGLLYVSILVGRMVGFHIASRMADTKYAPA